MWFGAFLPTYWANDAVPKPAAPPSRSLPTALPPLHCSSPTHDDGQRPPKPAGVTQPLPPLVLPWRADRSSEGEPTGADSSAGSTATQVA